MSNENDSVQMVGPAEPKDMPQIMSKTGAIMHGLEYILFSSTGP